MTEDDAPAAGAPGIRILWLTPTLSSRFGGPTTTAVNGVVAEKRVGLSTEIATTVSRNGAGDSEAAMKRLAADHVPVRTFTRAGNSASAEAWGLSPSLAVWITRNLRTFDIVHLQYVWCMTSLLGCLLAKLRGIPVVVTPHESLTDYDLDIASRSRPKRAFKRLLKRFYLRTVDCIVFMSELEERDTESGNRRTVRIAHAVAERTYPGEHGFVSGNTGPLRIGFLGRNIPKKGIDRLIEALAREPGRGWRLLVAGPSGTDEFVAEQDGLVRTLDVEDRVEWLGFLDESASLFGHCDVLAMPSAYEGFGMVAAEAMSHGLPVVVPRRSGVAEIVSEFRAGIVMDEPDVADLTAALVKFDEERDVWPTYSRNGVAAVEEKLTFRAYGSNLRKLYASLV